MKKNDAGDFSVLYVEPADEKVELFPVIAGQKKPLVLMLAEQSCAFQRPEDFSALKHIKRQYSLTIIFVFGHSNHLKQLATKNGFPVYSSMDKLADAISAGQMARQRALARPTLPLDGQIPRRNTIPLPLQDPATEQADMPLTPREQVIKQAEVSFTPGEQIVGPTAMPNTPRAQAMRPTEVPFTPAAQPSRPIEVPFAPKEQGMRQADLPIFASAPKNNPTAAGGSTVFDYAEPYSASSRSTSTSDHRQDSDLSFRSFPGHATSEALYEPIPHRPQFAQTSGHTRVSRIVIVLTVAVILGLIGSFLIVSKSFQPVATHTAVTPAIVNVGQLTFISSGQVNESSSQGISDQVVLTMHDIPAPATGKKYYAWLLGDKSQSDPSSMALGALTITNGNVQLKFAGDAQHSNLLLSTSRILITEEDDTIPPMSPSLDTSTWRYYGAFSSTPIVAADNPNHYSYLDHLRHLLAADPTLDELELPGGLNIWFYNNTSKLVEWAGSMRETWMDTKDTAFMRRQTTRVLAYLDGSTFLYKDIPANSPSLVDERLARVGLLDVNGPNQEPPDYVEHINKHLRGLLEANDTSPALRAQISTLIAAINNINQWLTQLRQDAQKIVKMSDAQFNQPSTFSLINDMISNANAAFAGQVDPSTGQALPGVSWLHDHMQLLATLNLTKVQPDTSGAIPQIIPGQMSTRAFVPAGAE
jgi:hypothetical protein